MDKQSQHFEAILITGGPGSGKTTFINALKSKGYTVYQEVARRVIKEQMDLGTDAVPWDNILAFSEKAKDVMLEEFPKTTAGVHLFDRGAPDLIGYLNLAKISVPKSIVDACNKLSYSKKAFIFPPWEEIYGKDNERKESFEEAVKVYESLKSTYHELGFELYEMKKESVEKRVADFERQLDF